MWDKEKLDRMEMLRSKLDKLLSDESRINTNEALVLSRELDKLITECCNENIDNYKTHNKI
ncbi:MAG: Spo0E family sporulation regulatory protein-aspartic acid phosphatase [Bacillota bacterium]|nr:Spo0E family sporulation regulatory protein-aspartic acid phosphatase [Bacillota bacterium]